jgi:hypothetical protein
MCGSSVPANLLYGPALNSELPRNSALFTASGKNFTHANTHSDNIMAGKRKMLRRRGK